MALQESTRRVPLYRDLIEYIKDMINLIWASPKRSEIFAELQNPADSSDQPVPLGRQWTLRPLCPTRWTTRHQSMKSVLDNYVTVQETLQQVASTEKSEAGTKANGLATVIQTFQFFFALRTAMTVFEATELLSKTVQSTAMTVTAASKAAQQTCLLLQRSRGDEDWNKLWASVLQHAATFKLDDPAVPLLRRPPRRIDRGAPSTAMNPEQYFRMIFNELLDNILGTITARFDQPALQLYCKIEETILRAANGSLTEDGIGQSVYSSYKPALL
jgi:hypothetical protein